MSGVEILTMTSKEKEMSQKDANAAFIIVLLVVVGIFGYGMLTKANPGEPQSAMMGELDQLHDLVPAGTSSATEREGHVQYLELDAFGVRTYFTVPAGKRFVLLRWYHGSTSLTVNGHTLLDGNWHVGEDLPDGCIVVNAGDTLAAKSYLSTYGAWSTIIGYFHDITN
jgi:hypothetical protein